MKVDFPANLNVYRKNATGTPKNVRSETASPKTDVVEFSRGNTTPPDKTLTALKNSIIGEAARPADSARLQELSQRVKDGTYAVSTDDLVNAILNQ